MFIRFVKVYTSITKPFFRNIKGPVRAISRPQDGKHSLKEWTINWKKAWRYGKEMRILPNFKSYIKKEEEK